MKNKVKDDRIFPGPPKPYTLLSEIEPKPVEWLWPPRIPLGELTVIEGDPGVNKSSILLDLSSRLSLGASLPGGDKGMKGGVVLLVGEDSVAKTLVQRLVAAGADLSQIAVVNRIITLPDDLAVIKDAARAVKAKLVGIDPLMPFLGPNANGDQSVRKALTPLAQFAEASKTAVVLVRHLNKSGGRHSIYRGSGSIGIIAATRSALLVAKAPHDPDLRVLCHTKNNLGPLAPSLLFEPVPAQNGTLRIEWRGECDYQPQDILKNGDGHSDRLEVAKEYLLDLLADGPIEQRVVKEKATEAGLAYRTVERAKEVLGVRSRRKGWGPGSTCFWSSPKKERK